MGTLTDDVDAVDAESVERPDITRSRGVVIRDVDGADGDWFTSELLAWWPDLRLTAQGQG
jgi:hypothetical protein